MGLFRAQSFATGLLAAAVAPRYIPRVQAVPMEVVAARPDSFRGWTALGVDPDHQHTLALLQPLAS